MRIELYKGCVNVNKGTVYEIVKVIRENGIKKSGAIDNEEFVVYGLEEMSATFVKKQGKESLFGINFLLFGTSLSITGDLILASYDENSDEGFLIDDRGFINLVNDYLDLRVKFYRDFKF